MGPVGDARLSGSVEGALLLVGDGKPLDLAVEALGWMGKVMVRRLLFLRPRSAAVDDKLCDHFDETLSERDREKVGLNGVS